METVNSKGFYRTIWRWHFYAGIFAIPFVIILSITGAIYLFKPQLDNIHDAPYRNLALSGQRATPEQQVAAALAAVPDARFTAYELPREQTDAVNILLTKNGQKFRAYIHPHTLQTLLVEREDKRFLQFVHDIHGELLLGKAGSVLVELAACWALVLLFTGIYLWWPRTAKGLAGVLYPRLSLKGRLFWRDLHSVIGMWISFFVLFLLISGLPWALVWGSAFKEVRELTGTSSRQQDWVIASRSKESEVERAMHTEEHATHAEHLEHGAHHVTSTADHTFVQNHTMHQQTVSLDRIVERAQSLHLAHPVLISPPSARSPEWSAKSNAQNRTLRADAYFNAITGELTRQHHFSQRHVIDRVVGIGIAAHEGQLFGWLNQLLGLLTATGLLIMSASGFIMWRKRAPQGSLGAPPNIPTANLGKGVVGIILVAAVLLPALGASLLLIFLLEKILLSRWRSARKWLGFT